MKIYLRERKEKRLECIPSVVGKVLCGMKPFIYEIDQELYWINGDEFWFCSDYEETYRKYKKDFQKLRNIMSEPYELYDKDVADLINTFEKIIYKGKTQVQAPKDSDSRLLTLIKPLQAEDLNNTINQMEEFRDVDYIKDQMDIFR